MTVQSHRQVVQLSRLSCHGFVPQDSDHLYVTGLSPNDTLCVPLASFWTSLFRAKGVRKETLVDHGIAETLAGLQRDRPHVEVEILTELDQDGQAWLVRAGLVREGLVREGLPMAARSPDHAEIGHRTHGLPHTASDPGPRVVPRAGIAEAASAQRNERLRRLATYTGPRNRRWGSQSARLHHVSSYRSDCD